MAKDSDPRDLESRSPDPSDPDLENSAEDTDFSSSWDFDDDEDDFIDIDLSAGEGQSTPEPEEVFERPVRKIEKTANGFGIASELDEEESEPDPGDDRKEPRTLGTGDGGRSAGGTGSAKSGKSGGGKKTAIIVVAVCVIVVIVIVAVLKLTSGDSDTDSVDFGTETEEESTVAWEEEDTDGEITALVTKYYTALVEVDTASLEEVLDSSVEIDEDRIILEAAVVEAYEDIVCYVTDGAEEGEYALYISYGMKFTGIDTAAPGLVPAYVRTDDEGTLRLIPWDTAQNDEDIYEFMNTVSACDAIEALAEEVQAAYDAAYEADEELAAFLDSLTGTTSSEDDEEETTEEETEEESDEEEEEETTNSASNTTFTDCDIMQYAVTNVKCRTSPDTEDTTEYVLIEKGSYIHVTGQSASWSRVQLSDATVGYVASMYLSDYAPDD